MDFPWGMQKWRLLMLIMIGMEFEFSVTEGSFMMSPWNYQGPKFQGIFFWFHNLLQLGFSNDISLNVLFQSLLFKKFDL